MINANSHEEEEKQLTSCSTEVEEPIISNIRATMTIT